MWENLNTVNFECLEFYVVTVTNTMTGEVEQVIEQDREQDGITLGKSMMARRQRLTRDLSASFLFLSRRPRSLHRLQHQRGGLRR